MALDIIWIDSVELINTYHEEINSMAKAIDAEQQQYLTENLRDYVFPKEFEAWDMSQWVNNTISNGGFQNEYYLLLTDEVVIGYTILIYNLVSKILTIANIYIKDAYRKKGYASKTIKRLIEETKQSINIKGVDIAVLDSNPAKEVYSNLGFKPYETRMFLEV